MQRLLHIAAIVLLLAGSPLATDEADRQPAGPNPSLRDQITRSP